MALFGQLLGLGFVSPLFYAVSLLKRSSLWHGADFDVPPELLYTIPTSVALGMAGPWVLASLPAPSILSIDQKVSLVRIWEIFPLITYIIHMALTPIAEWTLKVSGKGQGKRHPGIHYVYAVGLLWSAASYWYFWAIISLASMFPSLFRPDIADAWNFQHMLSLTNPFALGGPLPSISEGQFWFIQWDFLLISIACFVWALDLKREQALAGADQSAWKIIMEGLVYALILGPVGAAIVLIWQRDALARRETDLRKMD